MHTIPRKTVSKLGPDEAILLSGGGEGRGIKQDGWKTFSITKGCHPIGFFLPSYPQLLKFSAKYAPLYYINMSTYLTLNKVINNRGYRDVWPTSLDTNTSRAKMSPLKPPSMHFFCNLGKDVCLLQSLSVPAEVDWSKEDKIPCKSGATPTYEVMHSKYFQKNPTKQQHLKH